MRSYQHRVVCWCFLSVEAKSEVPILKHISAEWETSLEVPECQFPYLHARVLHVLHMMQILVSYFSTPA